MGLQWRHSLRSKPKVNNMRILDTEMICAWAVALQCSQRNYDANTMMVRELALQPASLFHGCGAKTKPKTKLFSRVIWKSNLHRVSEMHYSWMDVMYCGSCHGLRLELCWTSSTTSEAWNRRFWFIHVSMDLFLANWCYLHGCHSHVFHERLICRWKTLKLRCITNIAWDFLRPYLLTSISQWWTFWMTVTG